MYRFKLKENNKFKVGDVKIKGGKKSTVTDINPVTGTVTWDLEDVGAFDTVYKTFDKLNQLVKKLESEGEAEADPTIDSIADQVKNLFNKYRTHIRKNYPEAYERVLMVKEDLSIKGKKVKRINKNNSNNPEDYTVEYEDGTSEPYVDTLEESLDEGTFHGPREIAIYDGPDGETYIEKRGLGYYGYNNSFDFEAEDKAELKHKLNSWGYRLVAGSIDESIDEGEGDEMAKTYIKYAEDGDLSGVEFSVSDNAITIYQETEEWDGDDEDEEPTKYKVWRESTNPSLWSKLKEIALLHKNPDSLDEEEGIGYMTPKAFDKNKKSTGAPNIYYYKLGYKPVPKKIKGSGLEVKQLFEKEELTEYSDFQQKRISVFDEVEEKINTLSPLLSNAKSNTAEYYNENPGSYAIVYSTDMINELLDDITELLKQEE